MWKIWVFSLMTLCQCAMLSNHPKAVEDFIEDEEKMVEDVIRDLGE